MWHEVKAGKATIYDIATICLAGRWHWRLLQAAGGFLELNTLRENGNGFEGKAKEKSLWFVHRWSRLWIWGEGNRRYLHLWFIPSVDCNLVQLSWIYCENIFFFKCSAEILKLKFQSSTLKSSSQRLFRPFEFTDKKIRVDIELETNLLDKDLPTKPNTFFGCTYPSGPGWFQCCPQTSHSERCGANYFFFLFKMFFIHGSNTLLNPTWKHLAISMHSISYICYYVFYLCDYNK